MKPTCLRQIGLRVVASCLFYLASPWVVAVPAVDFASQIAPVLTRYCAGCHNRQDREGQLSVQDPADLLMGGEHGVVIVAGDSARSTLIHVLTGQGDVQMPPEGEPRPTAAEIALLRQWIDEGAKPSPSPTEQITLAPADSARRMSASPVPKPITAVAISDNGNWLAVARFGAVDLLTSHQQLVHRLVGHSGKVTATAFRPDGHLLAAASGQPGVAGEIWLWDVQTGQLLAQLRGHDDTIFALAFSPDGSHLATGGYDRQIRIWRIDTRELVSTLRGHNGPVFDLAYAPDGRVLASASGDATVKVWDVATGQRLDTLSQPLKEQYSVDISPDGKFIVAGGADNRLRVWQLKSVDAPQINPLLIAQYAHEQPIQCVRYSGDGKYLVSLAADQTLKVWSSRDVTNTAVFPLAGGVAQVMAVDRAKHHVIVGGMDGSLHEFAWQPTNAPTAGDARAVDRLEPVPPPSETPAEIVMEIEPGSEATSAQEVPIPCRIQGVIDAHDADQFQFAARAGQVLAFEVRAARDGSPLDSRIRILDGQGRPVPRVMLQAVRDSYFLFRGKNSTQVGDYRLHNWEEMQLNQYLFAAGEVVKLYHYPRGPDSGFNLYPNDGERHTFFDTTATTHALQEPCYIVEPHPPGTVLTPNGLPVFELMYENDDESQRRWARDSFLLFTAPAEGMYSVLIDDVRQMGGGDFRYELAIRRPAPDFRVTGLDQKISPAIGRGGKFVVNLERIDGFRGAVALEFSNVPSGLNLPQPLVIEAEHHRAWGIVDLTSASEPLPEQTIDSVHVWATATIAGQTVRRDLGPLGPIEIKGQPKLKSIVLSPEPPRAGSPQEIEIYPGTTAVARIQIERGEFTGPVSFGNQDGLINSPHGVFVANIGLNGVLITEAEQSRTFVIHCEPWVKPTERWVFVEAGVEGNPTSQPVLLRVLSANPAVAADSNRLIQP